MPLGRRREMQRRTRSPTEHLALVLGEHSCAWDPRRVRPGKANLSYAAPYSPHKHEHPGYFHPFEKFRPSLQFYLSRYLRKVYRNGTPDWDTPIYGRVRNWLERQNYTVNDFRIWGKILTADKALDATKALLDGKFGDITLPKPVPVWIITLLCRRNDLSAQDVRHLMAYVERMVTVKSEPAHDTSADRLATDEKTFVLICIRLLRKARIVHPESIENVANLIATRINPSHVGTARELPSSTPVNEEKWEKRRIYLAFLYNRILTLISYPTHIRPYVYAALQLRAQFDIIRRMSEYQPPLTITQMGYRAMARVQLMQMKTEDERRWAELKSTSWPPWKEDRTAMDSDIGPERGISRAGQMILRMNEAGYPSFGWDRIIQLYSGWDPDGSPVIQTRMILPRIQNAMVSALNEGMMPREFPCLQDIDHGIWAARVRTTRTVEESWAIFLAYEDTADEALRKRAVQKRPLLKRREVYLAMFERLIGSRKLASRDRRGIVALRPGYVEMKEEMPGDRMEALPTPDSPHERLDPRLQLPSVDELLERMISKRIYPSNSCLAVLLRIVPRLERGLETMLTSRDKRVRALLLLEITEQQIEDVPEQVFNAYIQLLCRYFSIPDWYHYVDGAPKGDGRILLHRAIALMDRRKSTYRPGWNSILHAVHRFDSRRRGNGTSELMRQTLKVLDRAGVELEEEGLHTVCLSFSLSAMIRRNRIITAQDREEGLLEDAQAHHFQHNVDDSHFLRSLFNRVVGQDTLAHNEPQLATVGDREPVTARKALSVPRPATLHAYIRALGIMGDYEGLLSVASFMHDNVSGLLQHCDNELNGYVRLRRAIVALRCFLERSWEEQSEQQALPAISDALSELDELAQSADQEDKTTGEPAPEELIMLVRDKVESLAAKWGHWPSDGEVEEYVGWGQTLKSLGKSSVSQEVD